MSNRTCKLWCKPRITLDETSNLFQLPCRTHNLSNLIYQISVPFPFFRDRQISFTIGLGMGEINSKFLQRIPSLNHPFFLINSIKVSVIKTMLLKFDFVKFSVLSWSDNRFTLEILKWFFHLKFREFRRLDSAWGFFVCYSYFNWGVKITILKLVDLLLLWKRYISSSNLCSLLRKRYISSSTFCYILF